MDTLIQRWKAQKSASKQHSADDLQSSQSQQDFSISQNQLFGNQNVYYQKSHKNDNLTDEDEIINALQSSKKKPSRNNSMNKNLRDSDIISQKKRSTTSKENLNSGAKIITSKSQNSKTFQSNQTSANKSTHKLSTKPQYNSPAKLQPNKAPEEVSMDHIQGNSRMNTSNSQNVLTASVSNIPPKPTKKNLTYILDESLFKIMEICKNTDTNQLSYQDRVSKVRTILETTVQTTQFMQNPRIQQLEQAERELHKLKNQPNVQSQNLQSAHSKIISELENKLFEQERQKITLENENQSLKNKLKVLEDQISAQEMNLQIWQSYKKSSEIIEQNNDRLQEELQTQKQQNHDQQLIFDAQISEISEIINKLKGQMIEKTYSNNNNQNKIHKSPGYDYEEDDFDEEEEEEEE